ncbi:MAG TPA: ABC transporter ATP-binding protein [Actinomycetota bacterium]
MSETAEVTRTGVVEVRALFKTYRRGPEQVHALRGVSFSLQPGEVVALFGPSGSGKSTLLNLLAGWEAPDAGSVLWAGSAVRPLAARPWRDVAILPQTLGLLEELSVRENIELPIRLGRGDGRYARRVNGFLSFLGLEALADRTPNEVSIGEQQRTALARALILGPRLLLADEPTGHQDEGWAKAVFRLLRMVAKRGTTCLIATHNQEAARIADRVLSIRDGQIQPPPHLRPDGHAAA